MGTRRFLGKSVLLVGGITAGLFLAEIVSRLATHPIHTPGMYIEDPELGYVPTPNFSGYMSRLEFRIDFTTGSDGLRGADVRPRGPNSFRILVLGDSQAWGVGVRDDETFSAQLEELLTAHYPKRDIQVLNGGVSGYGTADQLAFLRSRGPRLSPDLVVVQFLSVNDFIENRTPAHSWATVQDGMLGHRVGANPAEASTYPAWVRTKQWLKRRSRAAQLAFDTAGFLSIRFGIVPQIDSLWGEDFTEEDARLTGDLLVEIGRTAQRLGAQTLLMYTTGQLHVIQIALESPRSATVVEKAAARADVPWINATEFLKRREDRLELYYRHNGHWTAVGHRAVAELLFDEIVRSELLDNSQE